MTRKDWMKENYSFAVDDCFAGGVLDCPSDVEDMPDASKDKCIYDCIKCWNMEMLE